MLTGWLSPQGDFYACNAYGHRSLADELTISLYTPDTIINHYHAPDDFLLTSHWIKLFQDGLSTGRIVPTCKNRQFITDSQLHWLTRQQSLLSARQERCLAMELECN